MDRRSFLLGAGAVGVVLVACDQLPIDVETPLDFHIPTLDELKLGSDQLVWDLDGNLFLLRSEANRVAKVNADLSEIWSYGDEADPDNTLSYPTDIARGPDGNLYVFERGNSRVTVLDDNGAVLERIYGDDGVLPGIRQGALHSNGRLYAVESHAHRIAMFDAGGAELGTFGEAGTELEHQLNLPSALAVAPDGNIHVVDTGNARVQVFSEEGVWLRSYGSFGDQPGQLLRPRSVAIDPLGNSYVADAVRGVLQVFGPNGVHLQTFDALEVDGLQTIPVDVRFTHEKLLYVRVFPVMMEA